MTTDAICKNPATIDVIFGYNPFKMSYTLLSIFSLPQYEIFLYPEFPNNFLCVECSYKCSSYLARIFTAASFYFAPASIASLQLTVTVTDKCFY